MKKLMYFLMVAIPILVVVIVKLTGEVAIGDINISVQSVKIEQSEVYAKVGDVVDLSYTIYPEFATNQEVSWISSNETAATVEDGRVTCVGVGTGYISAITQDGQLRSDCPFYIWDTHVSGVVMTAPRNYVHVGKDITLTASVIPAEALVKDIIYSVDRPDIASVDISGNVHGYKEGDVVVTATSVDGGYTATVALKVTNPVTGLLVERQQIITSSSAVQIEYAVQPENATIKDIEFTVNRPDIATVNHVGRVEFKRQGTVIVNLKTVDGDFEKSVEIIFTNGYANDLTIDTSMLTIEVDSDPIRLGYTVSPENVYNTKVEFISSNEDIVYVDSSGYIYGEAGGNASITIKVKSDADTYIERIVYVSVISPAKGIDISDALTAEKTFELKPKSIPATSTNQDFFFHIAEGQDVPARLDGNFVIFDSQTPCSVVITIYANYDGSDVKKDVTITYTAGRAGEFELLDKQVTLKCGQTYALNYSIVPSNAVIRPLTLTIVETQPNVEGQEVIRIVDGKISAVSGGTATIQVIFVLYNEQIVTDTCEVTVEREPEDIEISLEPEWFDGRYVTSNSVVSFAGKVLPSDASEKNITWSVSDTNIAVIRDDVLRFYQDGTVRLIATAGGISRYVEVQYTSSTPLQLEPKAKVNGEIVDIPQNLMADDSFEVVLTNIIPWFEVEPGVTLRATNQKTASPTREVLRIENNRVVCVAGGTATLQIIVATTVWKSIDISVERLPDSITVAQANTRVTSDVVELVHEILPYDTTNKNVKYTVLETEIATIEGSTLRFKQNGTVHIMAECEADSTKHITFFIEKADREVILVQPGQQSVEIMMGDVISYNIPDDYRLEVYENNPIVSGTDVLTIDNKLARATGVGSAKVKVYAEQIYEFEVIVNQLVEDIVFNGATDTQNGEYLFASYAIDLDFVTYPSYAKNSELRITILEAVSENGSTERFAYKDNDKLYFMAAGYVLLQVESVDGGCTKVFKIRYTGGDAVEAKLNVESRVVLSVGEQITIDVLRWIPADTTNTRITIYEANSLGKKVIDLDAKTRTITAVANGETRVVVELSNGIVKEITIVCVYKVSDIVVESEVYTALDSYAINARVVPAEAANSTLEYELVSNDVAMIIDNVVNFTKPGTAVVKIRTTDGSNIEKTIRITSTMGHIGRLEASQTDVQLKVGETFSPSVSFLPTDAIYNSISFKILSQTSTDGTSNVVSLGSDGLITAAHVGQAVVRAYSSDYYGTEVFIDFNITVYSYLSSIDVEFESQLDEYMGKNSFVTSKSQIGFRIVLQPADAEVDGFTYDISEQTTAKIENNTIIFLKKGMVTITFKCGDAISGIKSVTYSINYVGDDLLQATLDKSSINGSTIRLNAGETFAFKLSKALPSDNENITFTIKNVVERGNDLNKQVARFEDGKLFAMNGGTYSFSLYANGLFLENLTLIVTKPAIDIELEDGLDVYVSVPYYKILAKVVESDSGQTIGFKGQSSVATVSEDGYVSFTQYGEITVTVYIKENPSLFKMVKITYTNELRSLQFNKTREEMYVGEFVDLEAFGQPSNAASFEYTMELDNTSIAMLIKQGKIWRLSGLKAGEVTVTAKVIGKNIEVSKKFTFHEKVNDIKLELDNQTDKAGHGGYRVFGTVFLNSNNEMVNTYQMRFTTTPASVNATYDWSSSNESIATVDENGVVHFLGTGRVTITVMQRAPYEGAIVARDSYEFLLVEGINVNNYGEFKVAADKLTNEINKDKTSNLVAVVLQSNIVIDAGVEVVEFNYNVYGNGLVLDHSKNPNSWIHFRIKKTGVILDNVVLRGANYTSGKQLKDTGNVLAIEYCDNVWLYNCIVENAESAIRAQSASATIEGTIIRNCLLIGVKLARDANKACDITIKDSVIDSCMVGAQVVLDTLGNSAPRTKLTLQGEVRFYNWAKIDQIADIVDIEKAAADNGIPVQVVAGEVFSQIKQIAWNKGQDYIFYKSGTKKDIDNAYFNFAVLQLSINVASYTFEGTCTVDRSKLNSTCNYSSLVLSGAITLAITIPVKCEMLSLNNSSAFIKLGDVYTNDNSLMAKIKKPCRF